MDEIGRYQEALAKGHQAVVAGRPRDALAHYEEAARLADTRPLPHVCIARVLLRMGQTTEAVAAYDRALERAPDDAAALGGKAAALLAAGRDEEAAAVSARLAQAEKHTLGQRRDAADAAQMREMEESGGLPRPEVLFVAGERAWLEGRRDTAVDAWLESGRGYADAGQLDAALDSLQRALLAVPGSPRVHLELARIYLRRGWIDRGRERLLLLDRLLELDRNAELRAAVRSLAREHAAEDAALTVLGGTSDASGSPPPA